MLNPFLVYFESVHLCINVSLFDVFLSCISVSLQVYEIFFLQKTLNVQFWKMSQKVIVAIPYII